MSGWGAGLDRCRQRADRDRDRNRGESDEHHDSDHLRRGSNPGIPPWGIYPQRLEHAPCAVVEMETQERHRYNVKSRCHEVLKRGEYIRVHLTMHESTKVQCAGGEVQDVKGDEHDQEQASVEHREGRRVR